MGYSCTVKAHDTLRKALNISNGRPMEEYSFGNEWANNGQRYFFERGKEHADGHISGTVFRFVGESSCVKVGSVNILPDGRIKTWTGLSSEVRKVAVKQWVPFQQI